MSAEAELRRLIGEPLPDDVLVWSGEALSRPRTLTCSVCEETFAGGLSYAAEFLRAVGMRSPRTIEALYHAAGFTLFETPCWECFREAIREATGYEFHVGRRPARVVPIRGGDRGWAP